MIDQLELSVSTGDDFLDRMSGHIDCSLRALQIAKFAIDPLFSFEVSREMSIRASAQKRQGNIIELAIRELLRNSSRHQVWEVREFRISDEANHLAGYPDAWRSSPAAYGEGKRVVQIDLLVFDRTDCSLIAYEVKRGNGQLDAGKQRQTLRDIRAIHALLKSYGTTRLGLNIARVASKIIVYYGQCAACFRDIAIDRTQLDRCFGIPVFEQVEKSNDIYRRRLEALIDTAPGAIA